MGGQLEGRGEGWKKMFKLTRDQRCKNDTRHTGLTEGPSGAVVKTAVASFVTISFLRFLHILIIPVIFMHDIYNYAPENKPCPYGIQCSSCSVFTVCATCNVIRPVQYVLYLYISFSLT